MDEKMKDDLYKLLKINKSLVIENVNCDCSSESNKVTVTIFDKLFPKYITDITTTLGINVAVKYILTFNIIENNITKMIFNTNFISTNGVDLTSNICSSTDSNFNKLIYNICSDILNENLPQFSLDKFKVD